MLNRSRIIELATSTLREQGLAGLTMRRLARDLGVQPGALYYYVASKQELLVAVGEQILSDGAAAISTADPAQAAAELRAALLSIRDGAEVIALVHAYRPEALGLLRNLHHLLAQRLPAPQGQLVAEALIRYVLGFVAVEQNRAELVRAQVIEAGPPSPDPEEIFGFGVRALLTAVDA